MLTPEQVEKLPKHRKDWLEIWGNAWQPVKTDGISCEACVYGTARGEQHSEECKANPVSLFDRHLERMFRRMCIK